VRILELVYIIRDDGTVETESVARFDFLPRLTIVDITFERRAQQL
jgi:hypothetical protein